MGAIPATGDLVIVKLLSTCGGEPTINDLSFQLVNPAATWRDQMDQVAGDMATGGGVAGGGLWAANRSTAFNTYALVLVDVLPGTSPLLETALSVPGDQADDVMPPNDSLCVTLRTDVKGRTGRGRMYLNGFPEGSANGGYWESPAQDAAGAIAASLMLNFGFANEARNMTWGVISRFEFKAKRAIPAFTPISSYTIHNEVRSLRRRAIGVRISRHHTAP